MTGVPTLRAAAAELGISRRRLQGLINDGMPITRKSERVIVDLDVARTWIALSCDEDEGRTAPRLHPEDPRYRERELTTLIVWKRAALKAGSFLRETEVRARYRDEVVKVRVALTHCHLEALYATDPIASVPGAVAACLESLTIDDPNTWPAAKPTPPKPEVPGDSEGNDYAPMFARSDPRHVHHTARVARLEIELAELDRSCFPRAEFFKATKQACNQIRKRVRAIPDRVRAKVTDQSPQAVAALLESEVYEALCELSGTTPEANR